VNLNAASWLPRSAKGWCLAVVVLSVDAALFFVAGAWLSSMQEARRQAEADVLPPQTVLLVRFTPQIVRSAPSQRADVHLKLEFRNTGDKPVYWKAGPWLVTLNGQATEGWIADDTDGPHMAEPHQTFSLLLHTSRPLDIAAGQFYGEMHYLLEYGPTWKTTLRSTGRTVTFNQVTRAGSEATDRVETLVTLSNEVEH
jgi:hypothetical protein